MAMRCRPGSPCSAWRSWWSACGPARPDLLPKQSDRDRSLSPLSEPILLGTSPMAMRTSEPPLVSDVGEMEAIREAEGAVPVELTDPAAGAGFGVCADRSVSLSPGQVVVVGGDAGRSRSAARRVWDSIWRSRWIVLAG